MLRLLDHWDNLDGTIERGYAGFSLWNWAELPDRVDPRYDDYARANASIGINGAVLNNVNANAQSLTAPYLAKAAALARTSPALWHPRLPVGQLRRAARDRRSADRRPARPGRRRVVARQGRRDLPVIPDFGGFLVKANSRRAAGAAGLRAHPRRRRQRARRRASRRTAAS